ncbi:MAG: heavy metal translocating P-type ATPase [Gemmatimonadota bacterium]|nr:heavy metal translocating P-type ATPase [Gemmatimonadota bacterium]
MIPRPATPTRTAALPRHDAGEERVRLELSIEGMHCAACVRRVEQALTSVPGVIDAEVGLATESARVRLLGSPDIAAMQEAVRMVGYRAAPRERADGALADSLARRERERTDESRRLLGKFTVGALLAVPVLVIGHWAVFPFLPLIPQEMLRLLRAISGLLTLPHLFWVGSSIFIGAWAALLRREANMDTLVALGTGSAWIYSSAVVVVPEFFPAGAAHPFYEATAVVITLVVLGQSLELRARGRTSKALRRLMDLRPTTAHAIREGREVEIAAEDVLHDELLLVRPGERLPVDGEVVEGTSTVDESMITGESFPVRRGPGDAVLGGTINRTGSFRFRATCVGADTVLARIVATVHEAQASKPPIQRLVDRVAGRFVPAVVVIAALSFVLWYVFGPEPRLSFAAVVAVSVLVIACPCALGLATPVSIMVAVGKAAELGVLVRDGTAFQRARNVDVVMLDKTGTLTEGRPTVADICPLAGFDEPGLLALASAAEARSEHPLGQAVVSAAHERGVEQQIATNFEAHPGLGVAVRVGERTVLAGSEEFLRAHGVDGFVDRRHSEHCASDLVDRLSGEGKSPLLVAADGTIAGVVAVVDPVRSDARAQVERLRALGADVVLVTGDHARTAEAVASAVGITDVRARVLPERKAEHVVALQADGKRVMMVGDGINDAPALARADVGVAVGGGADIAMEAADLTLIGGSLRGIADAIELSRASLRNVRQNLVGAFIYNVLGIPIAAGLLYPAFGLLLSPVIAGAAMAFSSVTVVTNANRLSRFRPRT